MSSPSSAPREPGWHPDPEAPASLQRYFDGVRWTDDTRPAGYVTQPGGPEPVVTTPTQDATPVFGATPPPVPEPGEARRRMTTATVAVIVALAVVVLALALMLAGVF